MAGVLASSRTKPPASGGKYPLTPPLSQIQGYFGYFTAK
jgi:hypothetical protein